MFSGRSAKSVEDLLDHAAFMFVLLSAPLDLDEAALLEHADRADVARNDPSVERPLWDLGGELCESGGRESAPELASDPVADEPPAILLPAADFPGHCAVVDDRPVH